jgi:hypothetical protein
VPNAHALAKTKQVRLNKFAREDFVMFKLSEAPKLFDGMAQLCLKAGFIPHSTVCLGSFRENSVSFP